MKKILLLFSALVLTASIASAQPLRGTPLSEKKKEVEEQKEMTNYYYAAKWAEKVQDKLPNDLQSLHDIAFSEFMMRDYNAASVAYKKLLARDKRTQQYQEDRYFYAQSLKMLGQYEEAKTQFESYAKYGADRNKVTLTGIELAGIEMAMNAQKDERIVTQNLGENVNSANSELSPMYAADGSLYYSGISADGLIELNPDGKATDSKIKVTNNQIFVSTKADGGWNVGQALSPEVNLGGVHNAHVAFSPDQSALFFSRCMLEGMTTKCDIYVSFKQDGKWMPAVKVEGGVNGDYDSKQPAIGSVNGKTALFFSSNMEGGYGGYDLYYALQEDGAQFATPLNVGEIVNTIADEQTPFAHNNKLYFSSTGHPGFGGFDVFSASYNGKGWSGVENLGADVNTATNELYYSLDKTGYKALVSSNRTSPNSLKSPTCCYDIYSIDFPVPVIVDLEVLAFDTDDNELQGVTVSIVDESGAPDEQTNETSNFFSWSDVQKGITYKVIAQKEGFKPAEITISTADIAASTTLKEKIKLEPIIVVDLQVVVTDAKGQPLNGVTVILAQNGQKKDKKSSEDNNVFDWKNIDKEQSYTVTVSKPEWGENSATFTTTGLKASTVIKKTLTLKEPVIVTKERPLRLRNINFDLASAKIRDDAKPQLDKLADLLNDFPAITKIEISAHTDARGGDAYNLSLSQRRAASALEYLVSKGIDRNRLTSVGKGETELLNKCGNGVTCTDEEHEQNRRVEFRILEGPTTVPAEYILEGVTGKEQIVD